MEPYLLPYKPYRTHPDQVYLTRWNCLWRSVGFESQRSLNLRHVVIPNHSSKSLLHFPWKQYLNLINHKQRWVSTKFKAVNALFGLSPFCFILYLQHTYAASTKINQIERLRVAIVITLIRLLPAERVTQEHCLRLETVKRLHDASERKAL